MSNRHYLLLNVKDFRMSHKQEDECGKPMPTVAFAVDPKTNAAAGLILAQMRDDEREIEALDKAILAANGLSEMRQKALSSYTSKYRQMACLLMPYRNYSDYCF
jgi:arginine deiminase